jgi:DNA-binding FadR family transcriptional regulator
VQARRAGGVSHLLLAEIGERIVKGELPPGVTIGNETSLMQAHGVSRTALREAIRTLAGKGLVEARPRTGTRVLPRERWNLLDSDVLRWLFAEPFSPELMWDLHEVRAIIEPAAAALASVRATDSELRDLSEACDRMDRASDMDAFTRADLDFHTTILTATHNQFVRTFASGIQASLLAFFQATSRDPNAFATGRPRHRRLLRALQARDPDGARAASVDVLHGASLVIQELQARGRKRRRRA